jgi:hypothetical protein
MNVLPAPLAPLIDPPLVEPAPPAIEPVDPVEEPAPPAVDPVDPVLDPVPPAVEPVLDPAPPAVEPVDPVPDAEPVEPVLDPVEPVLEPVEPAPDPVPEPDIDPEDPLPDPLDMLALVSMKPPLALELPLVPVAPVVPAPDALLPAPEPEVRHPVTTTVCPWLWLLPLVVPDCPCDPLVVCAAAPAPSATANIVPKRNCRFITSSVLG